jgi:beta-xylosidase
MNYSLKIILFAMHLWFSTTASAQKPILPDFHADPSAHFWDGLFWIYPSTDEPGSTTWNQMRRWHCYSSSNLTDWENRGEIFNLDSIRWASEAAFAPDALKWRGKYYFFFPAAFQIGVAISDKPYGPFRDAIGKPLIAKNAIKGVSSFDPCIFIDSDSSAWLLFGGHDGAAIVKLNDDLISLDGEIQKLELEGYHEGIWVHKKEDTYYFSYPTGITRDGKTKQLLVYSTAPTLHGPYTYRGVILDNNSRNSHHSIVEFNGKWYIFYHIEGPSPYERRVCVEYIYYNSDGSIKEVEMTKEGIKSL